VGYWQEVEEAGEVTDVPLIISSLDKTFRLLPALEDNHIVEYYELRPEILLVLYTERSLWDIFLKKQSEK
jgi:hypothetical protein